MRFRRSTMISAAVAAAAVATVGLLAVGGAAARPQAAAAPAVAAVTPRDLQGVNFVSSCRFSHRNTDDPIIYPRQPGLSHDHTFVGNRTTNAYSTPASLLAGGTTCRRSGDTAAYWVPTLIVDGQVVTPITAAVYYRRHTLAAVQPFPAGLKVIAGNAKATAPQDLGVTSWNCGPVGGVRPSSTVPTCPNAREAGLRLHVSFPDCWDGVNLDSADHQSHMAYSSRRGLCPPSHPVAVPALQVNMHYPTTGGANVSLASGGQLSGHADFVNAWSPAALAALVDGCLNALRHCQNGS